MQKISIYSCKLFCRCSRFGSAFRELFHVVPAYSALGAVLLLFSVGIASGRQRALGLDVSSWQGELSAETWGQFYDENREFVFIRSSRGGTTGFYDQNDKSNDEGNNCLSQRFDDHLFVWNITKATDSGLLAGPYHFARPDIVETTPQSGGIANTGADEADHFVEMAGAWMRPGYLLPVFDLDEVDNERTWEEFAQFSIDFSDRIFELTGIRPMMYVNGDYSSCLELVPGPLAGELVTAFPVLWNARYGYDANPHSPEVQTAHPQNTEPKFYGPWDDPPNPTHPWSFWQYAKTGSLTGYGGDLDFDVAQGDIEFVKDHLVPALWMSDWDGAWTEMENWNCGLAPVPPEQGPGQEDRFGPLMLPEERLPGPDDTVIVYRAEAEITVVLSTGAHAVRKLELSETLEISGGALVIGPATS